MIDIRSETTLFEDYGKYHRDPRNLVCHEIGIPLIVLAVIALLRPAVVSGTHLNLALPAIVALFLYYVSLERAVRTAAYVAFAGLLLLYAIAAYVTWRLALAAFAASWVFQFVGHAYEGKAPAFLTNLVHLLVGPLWIASHLVPPSASSSSAP